MRPAFSPSPLSAWPPSRASAADLTATEMRWLTAGWPVVNYAKAQKLPLDIVVQPQAKPGDAPLAMGFVDGRCKLVLAMRGNPEAEATLAPIEPALLAGGRRGDVRARARPLLALRARRLAHAAGRLRRRERRRTPRAAARSCEAAARHARRRAARKATPTWSAWPGRWRTIPQQYERVHAWFDAMRADQPVAGAHHDTRVWVKLARDKSVFGSGETPFERARAPWWKGLLE